MATMWSAMGIYDDDDAVLSSLAALGEGGRFCAVLT